MNPSNHTPHSRPSIPTYEAKSYRTTINQLKSTMIRSEYPPMPPLETYRGELQPMEPPPLDENEFSHSTPTHWSHTQPPPFIPFNVNMAFDATNVQSCLDTSAEPSPTLIGHSTPATTTSSQPHQRTTANTFSTFPSANSIIALPPTAAPIPSTNYGVASMTLSTSLSSEPSSSTTLPSNIPPSTQSAAVATKFRIQDHCSICGLGENGQPLQPILSIHLLDGVARLPPSNLGLLMEVQLEWSDPLAEKDLLTFAHRSCLHYLGPNCFVDDTDPVEPPYVTDIIPNLVGRLSLDTARGVHCGICDLSGGIVVCRKCSHAPGSTDIIKVWHTACMDRQLQQLKFMKNNLMADDFLCHTCRPPKKERRSATHTATATKPTVELPQTQPTSIESVIEPIVGVPSSEPTSSVLLPPLLSPSIPLSTRPSSLRDSPPRHPSRSRSRSPPRRSRSRPRTPPHRRHPAVPLSPRRSHLEHCDRSRSHSPTHLQRATHSSSRSRSRSPRFRPSLDRPLDTPRLPLYPSSISPVPIPNDDCLEFWDSCACSNANCPHPHLRPPYLRPRSPRLHRSRSRSRSYSPRSFHHRGRSQSPDRRRSRSRSTSRSRANRSTIHLRSHSRSRSPLHHLPPRSYRHQRSPSRSRSRSRSDSHSRAIRSRSPSDPYPRPRSPYHRMSRRMSDSDLIAELLMYCPSDKWICPDDLEQIYEDQHGESFATLTDHASIFHFLRKKFSQLFDWKHGGVQNAAIRRRANGGISVTATKHGNQSSSSNHLDLEMQQVHSDNTNETSMNHSNNSVPIVPNTSSVLLSTIKRGASDEKTEAALKLAGLSKPPPIERLRSNSNDLLFSPAPPQKPKLSTLPSLHAATTGTPSTSNEFATKTALSIAVKAKGRDPCLAPSLNPNNWSCSICGCQAITTPSLSNHIHSLTHQLALNGQVLFQPNPHHPTNEWCNKCQLSLILSRPDEHIKNQHSELLEFLPSEPPSQESPPKPSHNSAITLATSSRIALMPTTRVAGIDVIERPPTPATKVRALIQLLQRFLSPSASIPLSCLGKRFLDQQGVTFQASIGQSLKSWIVKHSDSFIVEKNESGNLLVRLPPSTDRQPTLSTSTKSTKRILTKAVSNPSTSSTTPTIDLTTDSPTRPLTTDSAPHTRPKVDQRSSKQLKLKPKPPPAVISSISSNPLPVVDQRLSEPSEELYCRCRQPYGSTDIPMIGCEGDDCSGGGWFHLQCLGITGEEATNAIKQKHGWLCPDCSNLNNRI